MRLVAAAVVAVGMSVMACDSDGATDPTAAIVTAAPRETSGMATPPTSSANDPANVFRAFVSAINNGNAADAKALIAREVTWERGAQCPAAHCAGNERVGMEIDRDIGASHHLGIVSLEVIGDTATVKVELQTAATRTAGVARITQVFTVRVVGGKIAALRAVNDLTDPTTAAFVSQRGRQ